MSNLAIIPARGGSKRIPKKNIKPFLGKPIIAYSIEAAIKSDIFDEVMVSTEDIEITEIAKKYGAKVPFMRSEKNANDFAILADVVLEVIEQYSSYNQHFDNVCCLLPTAPFINSKKLEKAYHIFMKDNYDSLFPIIEYSFPIQRALEVKNNKVNMVWEEHLNSRSQDLESRYHDSGQFYWLKTEKFLDQKKMFTKNSGSFIISSLEAQDIDTETDWKLAEIKYKMIINEKKNNL